MPPSRKKPGVAFWATVVVVVIVLYLLSFGPAFWLLDYCDNPEWACYAAEIVYFPILYVASVAPQPIRDAIAWYGDF